MLNLPNILTLSRIAIIPIVLITFFFDSPAMRWTAVSLFTLAGITDFFDGHLARRANQVSRLGRFLDPTFSIIRFSVKNVDLFYVLTKYPGN